MSCAACSARIERAVSEINGVTSCTVNLLMGRMSVEGTAAPDVIIKTVCALGYGISDDSRDAGRSEQTGNADLSNLETRRILRRLVWSAVILLPLLYLTMARDIFNVPLPSWLAAHAFLFHIVQAVLALIILFINRSFFIHGFQTAAHLAPGMDTLVALGAGTAYLYSLAVTFLHSSDAMLYFDASGMIVTLITIGKCLEAYAKGKTTNALNGLMALAPQNAVLLKDGVETIIPAADMKPDDIFIVRPGDNVPADGIIETGSSAVNESALTGESLPVDKRPGDAVTSGTVNLSGRLVCRATRTGAETTLSQIIRLVETASSGKAPIARLADKAAMIFVPVVLLIAVITFAAWLGFGFALNTALAHAIAVLVVSCPCALGLATPVAIVVGSGVGARNGILFKTAAAIETAGRIRAIGLDKTGTITRGIPHVTAVMPAPGHSHNEIVQIAASLEQGSSHPLAQAITAYAAQKSISPIQPRDFREIPGKGVSAQLDDCLVFAGNTCFLQENGCLTTDFPAGNGQTATYLMQKPGTDNSPLSQLSSPVPRPAADEPEYLGAILLADAIRPEAPKAISELQGMGIDCAVFTGDSKETAETIAAEAGISQVFSAMRPADKAAEIQTKRKNLSANACIAMVGDGINDAPALASADLGIAIGSGTDIAIDSADIILVNSNLEDVVFALRIGRAVLKNIRENLAWAFGYNIIGIPLAAGLFLPLLGWSITPAFSAAAMSISSACVVLNALRLNRLKKNLSQPSAKEKAMTKTMKIQGMMCEHCEARVKKILEALPQVDSAEVSHTAGTAILTLNATIDNALLKSTVEAQDYTVTDILD